MAEAIINIRRVLDTVRSNRNIDIISVNGDYGARFINAVIAVDGKPVKIDPGCAVTINARRIDKASKAFVGTANEDGTVTVPITEWMLEIPHSQVTATVTIAGAGSKLSATEFSINVQDTPHKSEEITEDDPSYDVLLQVLAGESSRNAAENERVKAEKERVAAEKTRSNDEEERLVNENDRNFRESERITHENERIAAEFERAAKDAERDAKIAEAEQIASEAMELSQSADENAKEALQVSGQALEAAEGHVLSAKTWAQQAAESAGEADIEAKEAMQYALQASGYAQSAASSAQQAEESAQSAASSAQAAKADADKASATLSEVKTEGDQIIANAWEAANVAIATVESISEEKLEPITWENGNIISADGLNGEDLSTNAAFKVRGRSGFIDVRTFLFASVNASYQITFYAYDKDKSFVGIYGEWVNSFNVEVVKSKYANAAYIRMMIKRQTDSILNPIDVSTDIPLSELNVLRSNVAWENGGVSSTNGSETVVAARIRSEYIDTDAFVSAAVTNTEYSLMCLVYDNNKKIKGVFSSWVLMFTSDDVKALYADASYIRILLKRTVNGIDQQINVGVNIPLSGVSVVFSSVKRANEKVDKLIAKQSTFAYDYSNGSLPVLYLNGDVSEMTKDNAVTLNYTYGTRKGTCTCKWQGSSSVRLGYPKRNYTIKFDNAFEAKTGWGSQKKYCMKANWIDPSMARNIVSARLWSRIVASRGDAITDGRKTSPNYGAVDGFPIVIVINGEFTGLYTHNIPKDAWMFNMGAGSNEYIVCSESNFAAGSLFKGLATFEGDETVAALDYSIEYAPDGVADATVISSFNTLIGAALSAGSNWETALAPYLDIDSVFDYFIFVNCIAGIDNLGKNILYGTYDGTKWFMSAYDLDSTYGAGVYGTEWHPVVNVRNQFKEAAQMHKLAALMYNHSKARLKARYKELRAGILSDENVWYMFANFINSIPRGLYNIDSNKWSTMPATSTSNMNAYMDYYHMHCAYLDKEIEAMN